MTHCFNRLLEIGIAVDQLQMRRIRSTVINDSSGFQDFGRLRSTFFVLCIAAQLAVPIGHVYVDDDHRTEFTVMPIGAFRFL